MVPTSEVGMGLTEAGLVPVTHVFMAKSPFPKYVQ